MSAPTPAVNPLREGLGLEEIADPCAMVIFGVPGDLTRRMLLPALYNLALDRLLPEGFTVIGYGRRELTDDGFRREALSGINQFSRRPLDKEVWQGFSRSLWYVRGDFDDAHAYTRLGEALARSDRERGTQGNHIFYLASPPSFYPRIIDNLGGSGLAAGVNRDGWKRIIIEKPFGHDLASARDLSDRLAGVFAEDQVYRIDHYLGKETVQNILVFRFANGIFEPIWNRRYIDHIQITDAEAIGIEGRGSYYEEAGALRDMVQNHMLQLLSLVAMEPPIAIAANAVRDEKVKVLRALRPMREHEVAEHTVRGQYGPGWVEGREVPGYRQEPKVDSASTTDTYMALKLFVDSWRWAEVPFYLRTGKRLPKRTTEIAVHFKRVPHLLFRDIPGAESLAPNVLTLRIQPNEGISLKFHAKVPGLSVRIRSVNMDFLYGTSFQIESPSAYETLLLDTMTGDSSLFARGDEVEAAWVLITDILRGWQTMPPPAFPNYEAGGWGPLEADELIERDGRQWRRL